MDTKSVRGAAVVSGIISAQRMAVMFGVALLVSSFIPSFAAAQTNESIEEKVRAYFADVPVMAAIAKCESGYRQFGPDGGVLRGGMNAMMLGIFQVYGAVHDAAASRLGLDLTTIDGNLAYARHLYEQSGTDPWISSFPCWSNALGVQKAEAATLETSVNVTVPSVPAVLNVDLSLGMIHPEVKTLQQLLNTRGYTLTTEGPGSPGQETEKFGALTREAVRKFQCDKGIACAGDEYATGYGHVGPRTRAALAMLAAQSPAAVAAKTENTPPPQPTQATDQPAASSEPATAAAPTPSAPNDEAAQIAALQAQIAELLKLIASLQGQPLAATGQ